MTVAKIIELSSRSEQSFEHAIREGVKRASSTLSGVTGAWVKEQALDIEDGVIKGYRVNMMITFILKDASDGED